MRARIAIRLLPILVVAGGLLFIARILPALGQSNEPPTATVEPPETVTLDAISSIYEPVEFNHIDHSTIPEAGCAGCHHHGGADPKITCVDCHRTLERLPEARGGKFNACRSCHPHSNTLKNPNNRTGLKRVYHVLCVGCHTKEDAGPRACTDCHTRIKK